MTKAEQLAAFVVGARYEDIPGAVLDQLKIHILDSLGCAIGALGGEPPPFYPRISHGLGWS